MNHEDLLNGLIDIRYGDGPVVAVAIHDGHAVREEISDNFAISRSERLREEDAFTGLWTDIAPTRVVGLRSRFEVDLNRKRHRCVYLTPRDAWGLNVWKQQLETEMAEQSRLLYDDFYRQMYTILSEIQQRHGTFFVYDLHAYNHRRRGAQQPPSPAIENPQINICTGGMDLERCEPVVECFEKTVRAFEFPGGPLDVRRNVRFRATRFSRWVHENFPGSGISIGIEVKKFYMDEWSGELDHEMHRSVGHALKSTVGPILNQLHRLNED